MSGLALSGFEDVSALLGPGVYALIKRGVVIYVGKSKSLYQRIYAHRNMARAAAKGKTIPTWMPIRGFVFDQVFIRPCRLEDLDSLEREMVELYKPKFNMSLKTNLAVRATVPMVINGVSLCLNPKSSFERRI